MNAISRRNVLAAMFFLGMFAIIAQITFMRELLVVFFGNELSIGAILGGWLIGIGLGAYAAGYLLTYIHKTAVVERCLLILAVFLAFLFPLQVYVIRIIRAILGISVGEYASLVSVFFAALIIFLPCCAGVGIFFPFACHLLFQMEGGAGVSRKSPVSFVYTAEALGSMLGGVLLTYVFLPSLSPCRIVAIGVILMMLTAALFSLSSKTKWMCRTFAAVLVALVIVRPDWVDGL